MSCDSSSSDSRSQKGSRPGAAMSVGILLAAMTVARTACADMIWPTIVYFELPRSERRALERVACRPFNVGMRESIGMRFQTETDTFSAVVQCAQHARLYGNPIVFERLCRYAGSWSCDDATELVLARYPDRQVNISAKQVSLTDAYWIVSYFVLRKDIERATISDPLRSVQAPPLDECNVEAVGEDEFRLECQLDKRWLKRLRSDGITRYQQVPLPWCATTDNPACVYGPALAVTEFPEGRSGGK
jgi:hypothetical protein